MIIGTGIDIIEVSRIKKALDIWGDKFLNRVFTKRELSYVNFTNRHSDCVTINTLILQKFSRILYQFTVGHAIINTEKEILLWHTDMVTENKWNYSRKL